MHKKYKLLKAGLFGIIVSTSFSACSPTMECNIESEHVHIYINNNGLTKPVDSEKEKVYNFSLGDFYWTENTIPLDSTISTMIQLDLYDIRENKEYFYDMINIYSNKRQSYTDCCVYGEHYVSVNNDPKKSNDYKWKKNNELITDYYIETKWIDIGLDEYTTDKVRDVTYTYLLYKIDEEGNFTQKYFSSLEDIEEGYNYFNPSTLVKETIGEEYYLSVKTKKKLD